jgi:hypothetical protein
MTVRPATAPTTPPTTVGVAGPELFPEPPDPAALVEAADPVADVVAVPAPPPPVAVPLAVPVGEPDPDAAEDAPVNDVPELDCDECRIEVFRVVCVVECLAVV